jgi:hypothetical protein
MVVSRWITVLNSLALAARIAGMESKKEYRAASALLIPQYREVAIVVPDLEIPGSMAIP